MRWRRKKTYSTHLICWPVLELQTGGWRTALPAGWATTRRKRAAPSIGACCANRSLLSIQPDIRGRGEKKGGGLSTWAAAVLWLLSLRLCARGIPHESRTQERRQYLYRFVCLSWRRTAKSKTPLVELSSCWPQEKYDRGTRVCTSLEVPDAGRWWRRTH